MKFFRKYKKAIAAFTLISIINQILLPGIALANNGSDISAEYSKGGGVGNDLVNMYNGAFNYKVDLLTVPGAGVSFPIAISYNSSDVNMQSVPTSIGDGWSLNIPKITRQVNTLPDDHNGDAITYDYNIKPTKEIMLDLSDKQTKQIYGYPNILPDKFKDEKSFDQILKIGWDNYTGLRLSAGAQYKSKPLLADYAQVRVSFIYDTKHGISINPSLALQKTGSFMGNFLRASTGINGSVNKGFSGMTFGLGGLFNFNYTNSGVPLVDIPMNTTTKSIKANLGLDGVKIIGGGVDAPAFSASTDIPGSKKDFKNNGINIGMLDGYYTISKIPDEFKNFKKKSFGLLYRNNETYDCVKDFLRHGGDLNKHAPFLPTSQIGRDIFVQSGGYGGVFTVDDYNVQIFSPSNSTTTSRDLGFGGEFGYSKETSFWQAGIEFRSLNGKNKSGEWSDVDDKTVASELKAKNSTQLLKASEVSISGRDNMYESWESDKPVMATIKKEGAWGSDKRGYRLKNRFVSSAKELKNDNHNGFVPTAQDLKKVDSKKLKYVQYLTTEQAKDYGNTKNSDYIINYGSDKSRAHHIAELNVFERDQSHLIYGEPVYNYKKVQANFSIDTRKTDSQVLDDKLELNDYEYSNYDKQINGNSITTEGTVGSEMLTKVISPAYATSWLIKDIPSRDYEDVTGNGISPDDKGDCVHFDYFTPQNGEVYKYRYPYSGVDVNQGIKDYPRDNMGSYSYGENELKYPKRIETKTHYAEFVYDYNCQSYYPQWDNGRVIQEIRKDGFPVLNEVKGGINTSARGFQKTWRLMEIRLYKKNPDGSDKSSADDFIQKVVLKHNYSLKKNHPSSISDLGVLTLEKVYSIFRWSDKGNNYKYEFEYEDDDPATNDNPDFNRFNVDGWGDYTDNSTYASNKQYPFKELPYVNQNESGNAEWLLKKIKLPSGADLKIDYEKNEYTYVQDEEATQFFDIVGTEMEGNYSNQELINNANRNILRPRLGSIEDNNKIIVELDAEFFKHTNNQTEWINIFKEKYIEGIENELLISAYVELGKNWIYEREYDWVDVVAQAKGKDNKYYTVTKRTKDGVDRYYGQIRINRKYGAGASSPQYNPIRVASFEKLKQQRADITHGQPTALGNLNGILGEGLLNNIVSILGPTKIYSSDHAKSIRLSGWSKIRLKNPNKAKKGGGYRVKKITLTDNWKNASDDSYDYILKYDYDKIDTEGNSQGSSGVATEPFAIQKESANWDLITYKKSLGWVIEPHIKNIYGHPLDQLANGGPGVGYEMITVKTEVPSNIAGGTTMSTPPYQRYEFYSNRTHPTIKRHTDVFTETPYMFLLPIPEITNISFKERGYSQGYSLVTNDMAGKLKSLKTFDKTDKPINGQEYYYHECEGQTNIITRHDKNKIKSNIKSENLKQVTTLDNKVIFIGKDQELSTGLLGVSEDIWIDTHENQRTLESDWYNFDLNVFNYQFPFFSLSMVIPYTHHNHSEKTVVTTKKIHKSGILAKVITVKDESKIATKYIGYDKETGRAILSSVENEFGDPIYKFSHSAYHEYDKFNRVEKSIDIELSGLNTNQFGEITGSNTSDLINGDLVAFKISNTWYKGFIQKDVNSTKLLPFSDSDWTGVRADEGLPDKSISKLRVLRSGNRNLVDASVGEIVAQEIWVDQYTGTTSLSGQLTTIGELTKDYFVEFDKTKADVFNKNEKLNYITDNQSALKFKLDVDGDGVTEEKVLNVSAVTFSDKWNKDCCSGLSSPFRNGLSNYWRPFQSFVYYGERDYNISIKNRSRNSGRILNYEPFDWGIGVYPKQNSAWVLSSEATYFDKNGNLLEQRDALGLYSASGYGYGGTLTKFVSGNSNFNESGFDGFEDYYYYKCEDNPGFSFFKPTLDLNQFLDWTKSHSGKYSLKIKPQESIKLRSVVQGCNK